jgi:hypothetical protein
MKATMHTPTLGRGGSPRRFISSLAGFAVCLSLTSVVAQPADAAESSAPSGQAAPASSPGDWEPTNATSEERTLPDGSTELRIFQSPVNYQEDGEWRSIDNELVETSEPEFAVENRAASYSALLPSDAETTPVTFSTDDAWVKMSMNGLGDEAPRVDGETATYTEVDQAASVTYTATNEGLKEDILLNEPPTSQPVYTYQISASPGLRLRENASGSLDFVDADGLVEVSIPAGVMRDSAEPVTQSSEVDYQVHSTTSGWTLEVTPSLAWLQAPERDYPVVVDPSLTNRPVRNCWMGENEPTVSHCLDGSQYVKVGRYSAGSRVRGLFAFNVGMIPNNSSITQAELSLYLASSQSTSALSADYQLNGAGKPFTNNARWNHSGTAAWTGGDPAGTAVSTIANVTGNVTGWRTFGELEPTVQAWVDGEVVNTGLVLRQANSENVNNVVAFHSDAAANAAMHPYLSIVYEPIITLTDPPLEVEMSVPELLGSVTVSSPTQAAQSHTISPALAPGTHLAQQSDGSIRIVNSQNIAVASVIVGDFADAGGSEVPTDVTVVGDTLVSQITAPNLDALTYPLHQVVGSDVTPRALNFAPESEMELSPKPTTQTVRAGCGRLAEKVDWGVNPVDTFGIELAARWCWTNGAYSKSKVYRILGTADCYSNYNYQVQNCKGPTYRDRIPIEESHVARGNFSNLYWYFQSRVCVPVLSGFVDACTNWKWHMVGIAVRSGGTRSFFEVD